MNWKTFEEVVKYIYENIGLKSGLTIEGYGNNCIIKGKSGVSHQIDVLFSHSDGVHKYLTAIECKYWNQKVGKDTIMKMQSITEDCNFDKGIIVSKFGFTESTIQYAKHYNIGLVELREPNQLDPEFLNNRFVINLKMHFTFELYQITNLSVLSQNENSLEAEYLHNYCSNLLHCSIEDKIKFLNTLPEAKNRELKTPIDKYHEVMISMAYLQVKAENCFIRLNDGTEKSLQDYISHARDDKIYKAKPNTIVKYSRKFSPSAKFWNKEDFFNANITGLIIEGQTIVKFAESESQIKNYALMIMKIVFENKKFILNEDGSVIEQDMTDYSEIKKKGGWKFW